MRTRVLSIIVLAFLLLASCRMNRLTRPIPLRPPAGGNAQYTVIGTMQNRDRIVTVKSGPAGVVYSITTKDGRSLYENIPSEQLKAQAPELHDFIETGTAAYAGLGLFRGDVRIYAGR